jgi:hypothetical protein
MISILQLFLFVPGLVIAVFRRAMLLAVGGRLEILRILWLCSGLEALADRWDTNSSFPIYVSVINRGARNTYNQYQSSWKLSRGSSTRLCLWLHPIPPKRQL